MARSDVVIAQIKMPRTLRARLKVFAAQHELSLRAVARDAFERLLAAEDGRESEAGGGCDRQPTGGDV